MVENIDFEIAPIIEAEEALLEAIGKYFLGKSGKDTESVEDDETDEEDVDGIDPDIERQIGNYLEVFREDLYCLIEYPYVDKVYRDSYYSYFASKHLDYQRDCIRVSLFDSEIQIEEFYSLAGQEAIASKFLGYFIIRPTVNALIGRSVINPKALDESDFEICSCRSVSYVLGVQLETRGFPHSSQDKETLMCAQTTIWALMEYFSSRYPDYKPTLPSQIQETLRNVSFERQLPSRGLTVNQISYSLKQLGFGTRIYSSEPYDVALYNIIDCYIESGIPVLIGVGLEESMGHVFVGMGKQYDNDYDLKDIDRSDFFSHGKEKQFIEFTNLPKKYIVQDDNHPPYKVIDIDNPMEHYDDEALRQLGVDSIVVPLYPKIYLEAELARDMLLQVIKDEWVGFDFANDFVFRFFLASSRSFKNHIISTNGISDFLKYNIIASKMPKFIWCGEIYDAGTKVTQGCEPVGLILLDATETKRTGITALIFASYSTHSVVKKKNKYVYLQEKLAKYTYYTNLKQ